MSTTLCRLAAAFTALLLALTVAAGEQYHLIENFTVELRGSPSVTCVADFQKPKVGLASAQVTYTLDANQRRAMLQFPEGSRLIPAAGMLKIWIKGDNSGNELEFTVRHARTKVENDGRRHFFEHGQLQFPRIKLDFEDWREMSLDAKALPEGKIAWLDRLEFHGQRPDPKKNPEPKMSGTISFDDLRLIPTGVKPGAAFQSGMLGEPMRTISKDIAIFADVRSFSGKAARLRARLSLQDRNGNKVAERDFPLDMEPNSSREFRLELEPENIEAFLPPFTLSGDVLSTDLAEVSATIDEQIVMGNAMLLVDDFSNVFGRWFTAGWSGPIAANQRGWTEWTHGEGQRASTHFQSSAAISRVEMKSGADAKPAMPAVPYAMQIDFNGDAVVYNSADRYLPGNPYRIGFWVKGDGSGAKLNALVLDFTNGADFWAGGWKRIYNGELFLCALDFKEWRYIEVDLPGRGLGVTTARGSTDAIDFPLELTAFRIIPTDTKPGSVQIGPVFVFTQQVVASTLAAMIGYDNPEFAYGASHNASITVQNGWLSGVRKVKANWALIDRAGETAASGALDGEVPAQQTRVLKIDLAKHAGGCEKRPGPFRLQVSVSDTADQSITVSRHVMLSKPDSLAAVADFEIERGYYGWKSGDETTAATSTEQAHSGKRALKMVWDKERNAQVTASIDPALQGAAVELTLHVFGDSSGAFFYPVVGGQTGVNHGGNQNNFFLLRLAGGDATSLQNGVRVDWNGWRELRFQMPAIPPGWDEQGKILPFIPTYPLGLHLLVDARNAASASGAIFVDDIKVKTHLDAAARVTLALERHGESNVNSSGRQMLTVFNHEMMTSRNISVSNGVFDWRNAKVGGQDTAIEIKPGEKLQLVVSEKLPSGAYTVRAELKEGAKSLASLEDDVLVCDLEPHLGAEWPAALRDEWKLRVPVRDTFSFIDEDWDWVEHYPGNFQMDTIRERTRLARSHGGEPYVLLGYGAYWSAGAGYEMMKGGAFNRRQRDIGHAVDIFMVPVRMEDWENYVCEAMRGAGKDVNGWILWDNPDSAGPMKVDPLKFSQMIQTTNKWRGEYCNQLPLLIGGMSRATAVPYLKQLREQAIGSTHALDHISGVQVRLDVGRLSPEDAEIQAYVRELKQSLKTGGPEKTILLSDLDWAVEKDSSGLTAFDQAAYLSRSAFLLDEAGIRPLLAIRNEDSVRLGLGLVHRRRVTIPPMTEKVQAHDFKPAWLAMTQTRQWLANTKFVSAIDVQDVVPDRTHCLLYKTQKGKAVAVVWRNDDLGGVNFSRAGINVESAQDVLGTPVAAKEGWFSIGKMPVVFTLDAAAEAAAGELGRLAVRDGEKSSWPQRVLEAFTAATGTKAAYSHTGEAFTQPARTIYGDTSEQRGIRFTKSGTEKFTIKISGESGIILRKRFLLDDTGHEADVSVNGKPAGTWNLRRSEAKLASGVRESLFVLPAELLKGQTTAAIEVKYSTPANTVAWWAFEYSDGAFPLSSVSPLHADQNFGHLRYARNITGSRLKIGTTEFVNGIGVFAQSLLEYSINRQFSRFTAKVGVDAVTEGKGSVIFEVYADGKKVWASGVMSGLDQHKAIDLDVKGVDRLRLIVTDAGDGNKFDAGNWCDPELRK